MAMQVGESGDGEDTPMSDINTTPLVDVMLVMLIIFLITVPVVLQSIPVRLPKVEYEITVTKPENVNLTVRADPAGHCQVYWNLTLMNSATLLQHAADELQARVNALGGPQNVNEDNMPEAHIRADINTPYRCVGGAIFTMQRAGYARIGFISQPTPHGGTRF
jgi:biopolymer transport protein ExbD